MKLSLGHSPDADDAFMFYAMAKGLVNLRGHDYEHILQDIETLNRRCQKGELDVSAVSFHAYTSIADQYALLPCGASFGDGYGPCLVAKKKYHREDLKKLRIAVPGLMTSAYLTLQLYLGLPHGKFQAVVVPFDKIQDEILAGKVDAGLLIHEGQLTYAEEGFTLCEDLGQWWAKETGGLPLPLGGNVVRRPWVTRSLPRSRRPCGKVSATASITARPASAMPCRSAGAWTRNAPTSSSGCTSTTSPWISVPAAAPAWKSFTDEPWPPG